MGREDGGGREQRAQSCVEVVSKSVLIRQMDANSKQRARSAAVRCERDDACSDGGAHVVGEEVSAGVEYAEATDPELRGARQF